MKHIVVTKFKFTDKILMNDYLKITKEILIPSLQKQTNKNFTWALIVKDEDIDFLKEELKYNFIAFKNFNDFKEYSLKNNFNIQTRHDCDDYMSDTYVGEIQKTYLKYKDKYESFLIQSQPIKFIYETKEELKMTPYHSKRNSMFLSLCQKNVKNHILEEKHGQMYLIASDVITLPEGFTKWVIHGKNKSLNK